MERLGSLRDAVGCTGGRRRRRRLPGRRHVPCPRDRRRRGRSSGCGTGACWRAGSGCTARGQRLTDAVRSRGTRRARLRQPAAGLRRLAERRSHSMCGARGWCTRGGSAAGRRQPRGPSAEAARRRTAERGSHRGEATSEQAAEEASERGERAAHPSLADDDVGPRGLPPLPPSAEEAERGARVTIRSRALAPSAIVRAGRSRVQHLPHHDARAHEQDERHRARQRLAGASGDDDERHDDEDDREHDRDDGSACAPRDERADCLAEHHRVGVRERGRVVLEARLHRGEDAGPAADQHVVQHDRERGGCGEQEAEAEQAGDRVRHDRPDQQRERGAPTTHRDRRPRTPHQVVEEREGRREELTQQVLEALFASVGDETEQDRRAEQPVDAVPRVPLRGRCRARARLGDRALELARHDPHVPAPRDDERQDAEDEGADPVLAQPLPRLVEERPGRQQPPGRCCRGHCNGRWFGSASVAWRRRAASMTSRHMASSRRADPSVRPSFTSFELSAQ